MIDEIYKLVQAWLNKDQLGYLKPLDYNLYVNLAVRKTYNDYLTELKSNVRKSNWHLEGKNMAKYSEHVRQLLEYYSFITVLTVQNGLAPLPLDLEYVEDAYTFENVRIDKIPYSDLVDLQRNIYASPNLCSPKCSKVGENLVVLPNGITEFKLHYLRKPRTAKWTFIKVNEKPMFDPTALDFMDIDMPETSKDEIANLVFKQASVALRELQLAQLAEQEKQGEVQEQNIQ